MQHSFLPILLAALATACTIPTDTLSNNITTPFGILIQNPAFPVIHDRLMNLDPAGGGDQHLFLDPVGDQHFDLVLSSGVLAQADIHAVIDGEYSAVDNTTKMFMTNRGDPKALFTPVYGCNPDNDTEVQVQLAFQTRETSPVGGLICVRVASGNRGYEFRYSPPDNPASDPTNPCMPVTMVLVTGAPTTTPTSTSSSPTSTPTATPAPYTDMTVKKNFAFLGCAPEERTAPDSPTGRTLNGTTLAADAMTDEACMDFCRMQGYEYAGSEYGRECWCGAGVADGRQPGTTNADLAGCNFPCGGNAEDICGGDAWLSLYRDCGDGECVNASFS